MKLTVKAGELSAELAIIQGAIEKKTTIPILNHLLLVAKGEQVAITGTDLEISAESYIDASIFEDGKICVDAAKLADIAKAFPKDADMKMSSSSAAWLTVECNKSKYRIACLGPESFPELPGSEHAAKVTIKGDAIAESFKRAMGCIDEQESRYTLNGALMVSRGEALLVCATNGHRLTVHESECAGELPRCIIPKKGMKLAARMFDGLDADVTITQDASKNHLQFAYGHRRLLSRLLTGNFPDYERVLPKDLPHSITVSSSDLSTAIGRLLPFADEMSKVMRMVAQRDELVLRSSTSEKGEGEELVTVAFDFDGKIEHGFNGYYISEMCKHLPAFNWSFKDGGTASKFASIDGKSTWVVMPMRI